MKRRFSLAEYEGRSQPVTYSRCVSQDQIQLCVLCMESQAQERAQALLFFDRVQVEAGDGCIND